MYWKREGPQCIGILTRGPMRRSHIHNYICREPAEQTQGWIETLSQVHGTRKGTILLVLSFQKGLLRGSMWNTQRVDFPSKRCFFPKRGDFQRNFKGAGTPTNPFIDNLDFLQTSFFCFFPDFLFKKFGLFSWLFLAVSLFEVCNFKSCGMVNGKVDFFKMNFCLVLMEPGDFFYKLCQVTES